MSAPLPPPGPVVRHYRLDTEYIADAANMEAAGWRLVAVRREPDYTIVATYTYAMTTYPEPTQPFAPVAPTSASRSIGVALGVRVAFVFLLCVCTVARITLNSVLLTSPYIPTASATYNPNTDSLTAICATATAMAPTPVQPTATSSATEPHRPDAWQQVRCVQRALRL